MNSKTNINMANPGMDIEVSYFKETKADGSVQMPYLNAPLQKIKLSKIIAYQSTLDRENGKKNSYGCIFPFIADKAYSIDEFDERFITSGGAIFGDIDHLSQEDALKIFDHFDEICKICPPLLTMFFSWSGNLHLVFCHHEPLVKQTYRVEALKHMMWVAEAITRTTGIDMTASNVIDDHSSNIKQQMFLAPKPDFVKGPNFRWNDNCDPWSVLDDNSVERLCQKYNRILVNNEEKFTRTSVVFTGLNGVDDDYIDIEEHVDYNTRWKIWGGLMQIFGQYGMDKVLDEWKKTTDKIYRYERDHHLGGHEDNDYFDEYKKWLNTENRLDLRLMKKFGYNVEGCETIDTSIQFKNTETICKDGKGTKVEEYITEHIEMIESEIDSHNCICIEGGTGIGKSVLIGQLVEHYNGIIATPFSSMKKVYANENIVDVNKNDEFSADIPCVMTFDRLSLLKDKELSDRVIFIDESHILFCDRTYRDALVRLMAKLKRLLEKKSVRVVLVSATPLGETRLLGCEKVLSFWKERPYINGVVWRTNQVKRLGETICNNFIANRENKYDRLVVFSNNFVRMVYDNKLLQYGDRAGDVIAMLHNDYRYTGDLKRVTENEMLDRKITLCTSLAFNGLNFKNENENILVVIDYCIGSDMPWKIIQSIGRLRRSNVTFIILANELSTENLISLGQRVENANILTNACADSRIFDYDAKLSWDDYREAIEEIEAMTQQYTTLDALTQSLSEQKYVNVMNIEDKMFKQQHPSYNRLKIEAGEIVKNEILEGKPIGRDKDQTNKYYKQIADWVSSQMTEYNLSDDLMRYVLQRVNKIITLPSLLDQIQRLIVNVKCDGERWEWMKQTLRSSWQTCDPVLKMRQSSQFKQNETIRNKYQGKMITNCPLHNAFHPGQTGCVTSLVAAWLKDNDLRSKKVRQKQSDAGKKHSIRVKDPQTGTIYDSLADAASALGITKGTASKWLKKGKLQEV